MDLSRFRDAARQSRRGLVPPHGDSSARELVYEPVDADGYPLDPTRSWQAESRIGGLVGSPLETAREVSTSDGSCLVVERDYPIGERHGRWSCADLHVEPDEAFDVLAGQAISQVQPQRVLYVDLETTSLSGGAGTVPFLVGCAWADGEGVHLRQFFLPSFSAERALLSAVADLVDETDCLVTFNGRTFDMPVIEVRGAFHRVAVPLCSLPHLDLLPAARRLWRTASLAGDGSCRLIALEQALVGLAREGDVPSWEIPSRYFAFIRRGDTSGLAAVFHHNRFDLLTLAALTARARHLVQNGIEVPASAGERLGLGRLYQRAGRLAAAEASYRAAADDPAAERVLRAAAWRGVAMLCRSSRRYAEAAAAWEQVVACEPRETVSAREAREALAIHHEHRARDLEQARAHAQQALTITASETQRAGVESRLARLEKKIARQAQWPAGRLW